VRVYKAVNEARSPVATAHRRVSAGSSGLKVMMASAVKNVPTSRPLKVRSGKSESVPSCAGSAIETGDFGRLSGKRPSRHTMKHGAAGDWSACNHVRRERSRVIDNIGGRPLVQSVQRVSWGHRHPLDPGDHFLISFGKEFSWARLSTAAPGSRSTSTTGH
jgi:hypothetical protein